MPCMGPTPDEWEVERRAKGTLAGEGEFEAVLCGVLSAIRDLNGAIGVVLWLDRVNWREVGVPRKRVEHWWAMHQAADRVRQAREQAETEAAQLRGEALAKLTPAERKALGVDDGD